MFESKKCFLRRELMLNMRDYVATSALSAWRAIKTKTLIDVTW